MSVATTCRGHQSSRTNSASVIRDWITPGARARGILVLVYLAVLPMAGAYLLFGFGLRGMAASTATTLALAEPVVATLLATQVLGEHLSVQAWVGLGIIAVGLVLVGLLERQTSPAGDTAVPDLV